MKAKRRYLANFEARSVMLIAAWTLGGAAAVHAQTPSPRSRARASLMAQSGDTLGSRAVPATQANRDVTAAFDSADSNHDGKLSRAEAQAIPMLAQSFNKIDTNHDGFISIQEYRNALM